MTPRRQQHISEPSWFSAGLYCLQWLVKCWARFTVFQMKQHPEALNYSWDGSQQTLKSTRGNPLVTLQLILLLNPAAECVCVCFYAFFAYQRVVQIRHSLIPTLTQTVFTHKEHVPRTQQASPSAPCLILMDLAHRSSRLTQYTHKHTLRKRSRSCWSESEMIKYCSCSSKKRVLCLCWLLIFGFLGHWDVIAFSVLIIMTRS